MLNVRRHINNLGQLSLLIHLKLVFCGPAVAAFVQVPPTVRSVLKQVDTCRQVAINSISNLDLTNVVRECYPKGGTIRHRYVPK
jgi:hypothetical protein